MQAILVANDAKMRADILSGKKQITIRKGRRDYKKGSVMLCCHIEPWAVMADITMIRQDPLRDVGLEELQDDGFKDHDDLYQGLKTYYPDLSSDDIVTIVRWDNLRGKLVQKVQ